MYLLDRSRGCVVHGRSGNGKGVPSSDTDHGHDGSGIRDKGREMVAVGKG